MRAFALALVLAAGCALTSRGEPLDIRYFSAELSTPSPAKPPGAPVARLRLDRVEESSILDTGIMHRVSSVEAEPYDALRWEEPPYRYVRRALAFELFEVRPLEQVVSGSAPSLDVQVLAFEQTTSDGRPGARVTLRYELSDDRAVLARGTVSETRAAASAKIDDVVVAIRAAMKAAVGEVAQRVLAALLAHPVGG